MTDVEFILPGKKACLVSLGFHQWRQEADWPGNSRHVTMTELTGSHGLHVRTTLIIIVISTQSSVSANPKGKKVLDTIDPPFLVQQSPTFLAPGTAFTEDNFSTDQVGHDFEMIHVIFIVYFISNLSLPLIWQDGDLEMGTPILRHSGTITHMAGASSFS